MPLWRNWQTRLTQNQVPSREYQFDPDQRHHNFYIKLLNEEMRLQTGPHNALVFLAVIEKQDLIQ